MPFVGAAKAVIVDASGKEYEVDYLVGADETYDVAKFHVANLKKPAYLPLSSARKEGEYLWILSLAGKKASLLKGSIEKTETFKNEYCYYTLNIQTTAEQESCPLLNDDGEVVALLQPTTDARNPLSYGVDVRFVEKMRLSGLSVNDAALRKSHIAIGLPDEQEQALVFMYMAAGSSDSTAYSAVVDEYVRKFPQSADGYTAHAELMLRGRQCGKAQADMEKAMEECEKKDEAHFSFGKLIFQYLLQEAERNRGGQPAENTQEAGKSRGGLKTEGRQDGKENQGVGIGCDWTFDMAVDEMRKAYALNPLPIYRHQEARALMAQKKYAEACSLLESITNTNLRSPELFYSIVVCKQQSHAAQEEVLAAMDSTVACFSKPYLRAAAPYLLVRAQLLNEAGKYRQAVMDFNDYESLMRSELTADFYYIRSQAEVDARMFEQAIQDIDRAISKNPDVADYWASKSGIMLRVGQADEAIEAANQCLKLSPDYPDAHLFLGIALENKGQKALSQQHLLRAKELGDARAAKLLGE